MKLKFETNTYAATLYQLGVAFVVLWLTRIFFYIFNADIFTGIGGAEFWRIMAGGMRFDLATLCYLNVVFVTMRLLPFRFTRRKGYRIAADWVYYVFNSIGILANLIDTPYSRFTNIRTNASLLAEFMQDTNAAAIMGGNILTYWYLLLVAAAFIFILVWLYRRAVISDKPLFRDNAAGYTIRTLILVGSYAVMVICIRGGVFDGRPLSVGDAVKYTERNRDIPLVLNTPFSIIRTMGKEMAVTEYTYFPEEEVAAVFDPYYPARDSLGEFRRKNVVILLLEGIGIPFVQAANKVKGAAKPERVLMPFLESLAEKSLVFTEAYSIGTKSSEGTTAVLGGLPVYSPMIYMTSAHNSNDIDGVSALLADKGYGSVFYCGCNKGSYGFESFAHAAGYKRFVGREEYGNDADFDGNWGIFDDRMGRFITSELASEPQPFVAAWFTISTHVPFTIPDEFRGRYESPDRSMAQTVEYLDDVLEKFFEDASREDWYANTLFVITADHSVRTSDLVLKSPNTLYRIPLILYTPDGSVAPGVDSLPASQLDITPTVLGYLRYNEPRVSLGNDLLDPSAKRFAVNRSNGLFQIMQGEWLLQFDAEKNEVVALFNRLEDPVLEFDIIGQQPEVAAGMETLLRAYIQQYTHRIRENRLSARTERE